MMSLLRILSLLFLAYLTVIVLFAVFQRLLIYRPARVSTSASTALASEHQMQPWTNASGARIGWQRRSQRQPTVGAVLILHGNAGTAVDREYLVDPLQAVLALNVFILEYPGYADRDGAPSQAALLAAATEAAGLLADHPRLFLVGESLGCGLAAYLAGTLGPRVAGVLLFVPYNRLADVATSHYPWLPVRWLLRDPYPAAEWLARYVGPVGVVLAAQDRVIPAHLGRALYNGYLGRKQLWEIPGADHEDAVIRPAAWWLELGRFWGLKP